MNKLKPLLLIMCLLLLFQMDTVRAATEANQTVVVHGQINADYVFVYKECDKDSKVVAMLNYGEYINCYALDSNDWLKVKSTKYKGYIQSKYLTLGGLNYKTVNMPKTSGFKSYMYSSSISSWDPAKVKKLAKVGKYGILTVNDRYCIAVGVAVGSHVGQYIDLILANGTVIPCIMCDTKAPKDCDATKFVTRNGCCSEFVVDKVHFDKRARLAGDVSVVSQKWKSPVVKIRVYPYNVLYK